MPSAFISYVRDNSDQVDKLAAELRRHGVTVWLDRDDILPGADWQYAIRQAIEGGDYFIACFSAEYVARPMTYMNTEIGLAVEMLQQMPVGRIWFIPVLLSDCQVPDLPIGGGRTLTHLNWEPLHRDWDRGVRRILKAMRVEPKAVPVPPLAGDLVTIDKPIHLELIRIPAGEFLMGYDKHPVDVAEFYIGKYPVTNGQYAAFVEAKNYDRPSHWKDGRIPTGKESHPVVYVSWNDADAFCDWLRETTGRKFRLPTETEREKAARGTVGREYPWGNELPTKANQRCNFGGIVGDTTPVGAYPRGASPYGVLDMAGNVWEWTRERVLRGGSFHSSENGARCANRDNVSADYRFDSLGLRVCVSPGL